MSRHRCKPSLPGFTLIELLVVISILAILAALLFPVFSTARRTAQRATCQSNARQLAAAVTMYAQDADELLPRWNNGAAGGIWDQVVFPYVKNAAVYRCPSNPTTIPGAVVRCYALPRNVSGYSLAAIPNPTDTVLLFDKGAQPLGDRADATAEYFQQTYGATDTTLWHSGGKDFAFVDGHVRFYSVGRGPWSYNFAPPQGTNNYGPAYCGGQLFTTDDADGGPGKNLPP